MAPTFTVFTSKGVRRKTVIKELWPTANFACQDTEAVGFLGAFYLFDGSLLNFGRQISI